HGDVLMWLMKTLLTSGCTNQRGAGHCYCSQIPVLLNEDGSIFNEGLADKLEKERKAWQSIDVN
ncbi:hypothetical protein M8U50_24450, partial [Enterobacter hormaechei]|nr:hypothetical protein [Enterobacter hormaechei]